MDVLTQLSSEHIALRDLLDPIEAAAEARESAALTERLSAARGALTDELDTHITTEEEEVFSVVPAIMGADLVAPFYEEHSEIRAIRDQVYARLALGDAPFELTLRLCDLILAHQQREDLMLFPGVNEAISH